MARAKSIDPLPDDIDRDSFANWLSGFSDGEATFGLYAVRDTKQKSWKPAASFRITLRDDDTSVLHLVQSFWQCGCVYGGINLRKACTNAKPVCIFSVHRVADMEKTLIPHFVKHPLHAKKKGDFEVWKQGVSLMYKVHSRKQGATVRKGTRGGIAGMFSKWSEFDREHFQSLCTLLYSQRKYSPVITTVEPPTQMVRQRLCF